MLRNPLIALLFALFSLTLTACDGLDMEEEEKPSDKKFTIAELQHHVLFSSLLLNDNNSSQTHDGFVLLFSSSAEVEELELAAENKRRSVLSGNYSWTISNDKLQVTYPKSVVCTTTKDDEKTNRIDTSVSCTNGTPKNDKIEKTLHKPVAFNKSSLANKKIVFQKEDNSYETIQFESDDTFKRVRTGANNADLPSENGTYENSIYKNVVRLNFTDEAVPKYSLFILLNGTTSNGSLLELRYVRSNKRLSDVRFYKTNINNNWETTSYYTEFLLDNQ